MATTTSPRHAYATDLIIAPNSPESLALVHDDDVIAPHAYRVVGISKSGRHIIGEADCWDPCAGEIGAYKQAIAFLARQKALHHGWTTKGNGNIREWTLIDERGRVVAHVMIEQYAATMDEYNRLVAQTSGK